MVEMEVERQEALEPQPEELQQVLITVKRWFDQDREAKEFYVREMDENDKLYEGHHWDLNGPDGNPLRSKRQQAMRPNAVENVTFSLVAGAVSEFSDPVEIVDFPVEPGDDEVARLMTDLKQYILDKNDHDMQRMAWNWNFFWHGTGIWEVSWDPTWKGGRGPNRWVGEVRLINRHPRTVFPDARCGDNVQNGRRIHVVSYVPIEYVRENFPEWGYMVRESTVDEAIAGRVDSAAKQIGVVALVTTWYIGEPLLPTKEDAENKSREGIGLHKIFWADLDNPVFLDHENHLYFAESEMPRFPFIFRQRYPRKDPSVWGHGEPYFLKNPQIIHNKTVEILIEGHVHSALGQGFYEPQALDEKQMKALKTQGTLPGMWFAVNDINRVKRIYGQSMPSSLLQEAQRLPRMMEQIMGRFDISQGKTPGSVTAFRALDLIAQRAQVRLKAVDLAIRSAYKEIGEWMNRHIWNYYTGRRAYRIVGENEHGLYLKKQGVFSIDDYRKVYDFVTGEVVPYTAFQPLEGMVEGTDYEVYNPELDVRVRTTQQMPSDRLFYMELAKEMYLMKLLDPQTMFEVMRDGRFPHWDRMKDRVLAYLQQQTGQVQHPAAGAQDMGERSVLRLNQRPEIEAVLRQLTDEQLDALSQMTPEEQEEFFARLIETPPQ
ncbi:hypothetical protein [Symbiobacterium thermophilum]|uniref:Portal protein n=1 Tax=Symbiobacterium thermophilum TaxID=2734 RepID=A0A953LI01_SYMTR|nr:hypothetical protein [Symbiobacterium thermophilum]MBY6275494.1 hypothetical protein [Symbiobacterium thermophilum]